MKKSLLILSSLGLMTSGLLAQQVKVNPEHRNIKVQGPTYVVDGKTLKPTSRGANDVSKWYDFVTAYEQGELLGGSDIATYVQFIYPDTTGYIVGTDSQKDKMAFHVVGSTFDPKDSNFLAVPIETLTKFNPYHVDSLKWTQFYIRQLDSVDLGAGNVEVVDTLYIQYFDIAGMEVKSFYFTADPSITHYYGIPKQTGYSTKTLRNSGALKTDTVLLTAQWADSMALNGANTTFYGRQIIAAPDYDSKSTNTTPIWNNLTAFSMSFSPMVKTQLGDTLLAYDGSTWTKKYNLFGVRLGFLDQHDQVIKSPYRINNFFVTNFELRYGATIGIFKSYFPGTVFGSTIFFPHEVHLTTNNLDVNEAKANGFSNAIVYPNPSSGNSAVVVAFEVSKTSEVTATITDLKGSVIRTVSKSCVAGVNMISMETNGMSKGMYMVTLESAAGKTSTKLSIQ